MNQEFTLQKAVVLDKTMTYVDEGQGPVFLFLHGNPTSSYLWRNIIGGLKTIGRCIAPDLIGMGGSDKLEGQDYRFVQHRKYLDAFIEQLDLETVTLVLHDWGSALGFDWSRRHPGRVSGLVYMEAIVKTMSWEEFPALARPMFEKFRSPEGEHLILDENFFVEQMLPLSVMRKLDQNVHDVYRQPFLNSGSDRLPTLTWPREIPIDGAPSDVHEIVTKYSDWLQQCDLPKLFVNCEPGVMLTGVMRDYCRTFKNQTEVTVAGLHYPQEDSPEDIVQAIKHFVEEHSLCKTG